MDIQASIEQVAGILVREELAFQTHDDGDSYRLLFGRDAVFIHFAGWQDGVRVFLTSPALQGIEPDEAGAAVALARLNDHNRGHRFVKWVLVDDTLLAVHDLLGEDLQRSELVNAICAMAAAVEAVAEELEEETGGLRYADVCEAEVEVEDE